MRIFVCIMFTFLFAGIVVLNADAGIVKIRVLSDEVLELHMAEGVDADNSCVADNWTIKGSDGSNLAVEKCSLRSVPYYADQSKWPFDIHAHDFFYLQLETPMKPGIMYTVTMKDGVKAGRDSSTIVNMGGKFSGKKDYQKVSYKNRPWKGKETENVKFDPDRTICYSIKHNHLGFVAKAKHKYAYVGSYMGSGGGMPVRDRMKTMELVNAKTKEVVWTGTLRKRNQLSKEHGENLYDVDFGEVKTPGIYYLRCKALGRSREFTINDDVFAEALYVTVRGVFQQRCGIAIDKKYSDWPRPICHNPPHTWICNTSNIGDVFRKYYKNPISPPEAQIGKERLTGEKITPGVIGGWHDAADYDRGSGQSHDRGAWAIFAAYEMFPHKFVDKQFNIPESGNGIPDIIDEALWGMKLWMNLRKPDGGVYYHLEGRQHPGDLPHKDELHYFAFQPKPDKNYAIAGLMAQTANILRPFKPKLADDYLRSAKKAYLWAAKQDGEYADERAWGAAELFKATGDKKYEKEFIESSITAKDPESALTVYKKYDQVTATLAYALCKRDNVDAKAFSNVKQAVIRTADEYVDNLKRYGYRASKGRWRPYSHGGGAVGGLFTKEMAVAYHLTGDEKYLEAAYPNADFQLGGQALGKSWITGLGHDYPYEMQHIISLKDGIEEPVPGTPLYGPRRMKRKTRAPNNPRSLSEIGESKFYPFPAPPLYVTGEIYGIAYWGEFLLFQMGATVLHYAFVAPDEPVSQDRFK